MRTTIYIHELLWRQAKELAAGENRTFSNLITKLLIEKLKKGKEDKRKTPQEGEV